MEGAYDIGCGGARWERQLLLDDGLCAQGHGTEDPNERKGQGPEYELAE